MNEIPHPGFDKPEEYETFTTTNGLEEAAEQYAYNGTPDEWRPRLKPIADEIIKNFIAGAKWQKEQMMNNGTVILAEEDFDAEKEKSMERGYNLCKEQMMKEAVEGYVNYYEDSGGILMAEAQVGCPYHNGDKVRIIIVKED